MKWDKPNGAVQHTSDKHYCVMQATEENWIAYELIQNGTAGPQNSTRPAIQYIYESGFTQQRVGYASAMSFAFFLVVVAISLALFSLLRRSQR